MSAFTYDDPIDNCTGTTTYQADQTNGNTLPNFIAFDSNSLVFTIYSSDYSDADTYNIRVTFTLSTTYIDLSDTLTFTVTAKTPAVTNYSVSTNTAPYFASALTDQTVKAGNTLEYKLPNILDLEGDDYIVTVDTGSASVFSSYDTA